MTFETLPATAFKWPAVLLSGVVDYDMYMKFRSQFDEAWGQDLAIGLAASCRR